VLGDGGNVGTGNGYLVMVVMLVLEMGIDDGGNVGTGNEYLVMVVMLVLEMGIGDGGTVGTGKGYLVMVVMLVLEILTLFLVDYLWCKESAIVKHNAFRLLPYFGHQIYLIRYTSSLPSSLVVLITY